MFAQDKSCKDLCVACGKDTPQVDMGGQCRDMGSGPSSLSLIFLMMLFALQFLGQRDEGTYLGDK